MAINFRAPVVLMRRFLPGMLRAGRGHIIHINAIGGMYPAPFQGPYCAGKAALMAYCTSLAFELRGTGVHLSSLYPGGIDTAFLDGPNLQGFRRGRDLLAPATVAAAVLEVMRTPRATVVFGSPVKRLAVRLAQLFPTFFQALIERRNPPLRAPGRSAVIRLAGLSGYARFFRHKPWVLQRAVRGVFTRVVRQRPYLRVAEIAVTFACNSRCVMCSCVNYWDAERERTRLTPAEYGALGRQLDRMGCLSVNVTGGEPTLRRDLDEVITALNPAVKIVNLITNGLRLDPARIRRLAALGVDSIVVSLESTDAAENDRIRGHVGHFQAVMDTIASCRKARVPCGISLTVGGL